MLLLVLICPPLPPLPICSCFAHSCLQLISSMSSFSNYSHSNSLSLFPHQSLISRLLFLLCQCRSSARRRRVLQQSAGVHDVGGVNWLLLAALALTWLFIAASLARSMLSIGKARTARSHRERDVKWQSHSKFAGLKRRILAELLRVVGSNTQLGCSQLDFVSVCVYVCEGER